MTDTQPDPDRRNRILSEALRRGYQRRRRRREVALGVATVAVVLLGIAERSVIAGPSKINVTTSASRPHVTPPSSVPPTSSTSTGATESTSPTSARPCRVAQLSASLGAPTGALGNYVASGSVANVSSSGCTVRGYLSVALADGQGHPIAQQVVPIGPGGCSCVLTYVPPQTVALNPRQSATFSLTYRDNPTGNEPPTCPTAEGEAFRLAGDPTVLETTTQLPSVCGTIFLEALHR